MPSVQPRRPSPFMLQWWAEVAVPHGGLGSPPEGFPELSPAAVIPQYILLALKSAMPTCEHYIFFPSGLHSPYHALAWLPHTSPGVGCP